REGRQGDPPPGEAPLGRPPAPQQRPAPRVPALHPPRGAGAPRRVRPLPRVRRPGAVRGHGPAAAAVEGAARPAGRSKARAAPPPSSPAPPSARVARAILPAALDVLAPARLDHGALL